MSVEQASSEAVLEREARDELQALLARQHTSVGSAHAEVAQAVCTARLAGFDLGEAPVLAGLARLPGQLVAARTTVPLRRAMVGAAVVVVFEDGVATRPIVIGVLQEPHAVQAVQAVQAPTPVARFDVQADGERLTLTAEREIVLRCGDASISLTRSGKVVIKGNYILSRSTGYNKIKGAAIDIN